MLTLPGLLLIAGLALIVAEALLPSGGILAILASVSIAASIGFAFAESNEVGLNFLGLTGITVPLVLVFGMKLFPKTPWGKQAVRTGLSFDSSAGVDASLAALIGQTGLVEADCRPAGIARFEGRRIDVVSRGEWITAGSSVEVIEVQGNRVIVRGLPSQAGGPESQPS